jgi:hypothetical protein
LAFFSPALTERDMQRALCLILKIFVHRNTNGILNDQLNIGSIDATLLLNHTE